MKNEINSRIVREVLVIIGLLALLGTNAQGVETQTPPRRLGLIGLDTSHVVRYAQLLNAPSSPDHVAGARVAAAFKGGSPDMEQSARRIERFAAEVRDKWKVELVGSIEELC